MARVKPSHYQFDSSHIGATSSSDRSADHGNQSEPVVYAKVNKHRATEKTTANNTEGKQARLLHY